MQYFNYFSCKEFFPNCNILEISDCIVNGYFDNLLCLFMVLDGFREFINFPIRVTSSYRDSVHNKRVGGSSTSDHLTASAVDIVVSDLPFDSVSLLFKEFTEMSALSRFLGQVIIYKRKKIIHIALRTPKHPKLQFYYE